MTQTSHGSLAGRPHLIAGCTDGRSLHPAETASPTHRFIVHERGDAAAHFLWGFHGWISRLWVVAAAVVILLAGDKTQGPLKTRETRSMAAAQPSSWQLPLFLGTFPLPSLLDPLPERRTTSDSKGTFETTNV